MSAELREEFLKAKLVVLAARGQGTKPVEPELDFQI